MRVHTIVHIPRCRHVWPLGREAVGRAHRTDSRGRNSFREQPYLRPSLASLRREAGLFLEQMARHRLLAPRHPVALLPAPQEGKRRLGRLPWPSLRVRTSVEPLICRLIGAAGLSADLGPLASLDHAILERRYARILIVRSPAHSLLDLRGALLERRLACRIELSLSPGRRRNRE